jgi:hypothetical protein
MGKLIKNHWARLIVLTAAACKSPPHLPIFKLITNHPLTDQVAAGVHGFFWPKIFWDFLTTNLDGAVKPFPALQIINVVCGLVILAWEWPLKLIAKTAFHRSIETRLVLFPIAALAAALLYQGTNPAIYYTIGIGIYFWAYSEGEVVVARPWSLPPRGLMVGKV